MSFLENGFPRNRFFFWSLGFIFISTILKIIDEYYIVKSIKRLPYTSIDMNQCFNEKKSQSAVKGKKCSVKNIPPSKIKKNEIIEKNYFCFTCEFGTNDKKDYKRHIESKKHIKNEEMEKKEMEERKEQEIQKEQEEIKRIFWKYNPAHCRNGCVYNRGEKYWETDGITNKNWLCRKCDDEECERLFGFSKKPPSENVIIHIF